MDLRPQSTRIFSAKRALLRWGVECFCRMCYTALQHRMLSFIDAPSDAGSLNESPLADTFGSIKNSLVYLHNQQTIMGTFPNSCSLLFSPYLQA